ncbi:MAG: hypothetical protein ABEK01_00505 [Candidatus Nanohaloarchaea archaeon]
MEEVLQVMNPDTFFGFIGAVLFAGMTYYAYRTLQNFREHREVSMAEFLIDERGIDSFVVLAFSSLLYAFSMVAVALELVYPNYYLKVLTRGMLLGVAAGMTYFFRNIYLVTEAPGRGE